MSQHSPLNQQTLNQQIASLQQQLPRQRQQLAQQTAAVGTALCYRLGSPSALALAALTGVVGGLWFYRRDTDTEAVPADDTAITRQQSGSGV